MSDLVTGEAVVLELRLAQLPSRALAFAVDVAIMALGLVAVLIPAEALAGGVDATLGAVIALVTVASVVVGYPLLWETVTRGRTPGKYLLGLRVVRDDGGPIGFRHALTRSLAGLFVDFWVLGFLGCVALFASLISRRGKRVGDLLAGTVVVRERVPATAGSVAEMPPQLAAWAAGLELSALPDDLALAARQFLGRRDELNPAVRDDLAGRLAADVARHVGHAVPPGVPPSMYLSAVLAERRRRELARHRQPAQTGPPPGSSTTPPPAAPLPAAPPPPPSSSPEPPQQPTPAPRGPFAPPG